MLSRVLEPEVMESAEGAAEYDAMDHSTVNDIFVTDLLPAIKDWSLQRPVTSTTLNIVDLGAGTAQIPIKLARRAEKIHIVAVDAAASMLAVARNNLDEVGLSHCITTVLADAKQLPFDSGAFDVAISNSIVHHVPEPRGVVDEAVRVTMIGGLFFHRDLARPTSEAELERLVATYTAGATRYQRTLFAESLRAALTVDEMADLVERSGFDRDSVRMTSDRHWTWTAIKS
ncbi:MAG TPA: methyltransferase domain-containing protein [Lacipirellulaceae bacterium]|jgi:ubiquinone/menaquinone biosynthesis C-methylase UbiE|nr:methyltransferase domain-containing protein [Lacipirellulaceae bacterium]